ncbi:MAG: hypothetical protein ABI761_09835 [Saprospiraceae bacterium]
MSEQEIVKTSLVEICNKLGYAPVTMTQRNYEHLSQEIEDKTGILISISTIKRLLNGDFARLPQTATLNAISTFLGYKNWQEYKMDHLKSFVSETAIDDKIISKALLQARQSETIDIPPPAKKLNLKWVIYVAPLLVILAFIKIKSRPVFNADQATFTVQRTTSNDIPNTVVFNYDIDKVVADSFFIQQSWDKNRRVRISKQSHTLTDIYYEPGYHTAKLYANDSIIRTISISIPSDRWFCYAYDIKPGNVQVEIKSTSYLHDGYLGFDTIDLIRNQIKTEAEPIYFQTFFPSKIEFSSDSFIYKATVRMKEIKPLKCPFIVCEIFGQNGSVYFMSDTKGCANHAAVHIGNKHIPGSDADLSTLCGDPFQWTEYEMRVNADHLIIYRNGQEVYITDIKSNMGKITGLGFLSNGICQADQVSLTTPAGSVIYKNNFEQVK